MIPSPDEKVLLEKIMDDEGGWNDVDDVIADSWMRRLLLKKKTICFEELYNKDVASRPTKDNVAQENVASGKVAKTRVAKAKVAPKKVSEDALLELENQLLTVLENGFKEIHKKIDAVESCGRKSEVSKS